MTRAVLRIAAGLLVLFLAGCTTPERTTRMARSSMVGLSQGDVRMCAGFPQRTSREADGSEIWSYETNRSDSGLTVSAPILYGAANTSVSMRPGGGNCKVQIRFVDGMAERVVYAGNRNTSLGRDAVCEPIVSACIDYAREQGEADAAREAAARQAAARNAAQASRRAASASAM